MLPNFRMAWLVTLALPIGVFFLIIWLLLDQYRLTPTNPAIAPRQVISSTSGLQLLSRLEICAAGHPSGNFLLALGQRVVYLYSDGTPKGPYIRLQDVSSASPAWQSAGTRYPFAMAAFRDRLFFTTSTDVRAYTLTTGELLWQAKVLPGHSGSVILPDFHDGVTVYYTQDSPLDYAAYVLTLDPDTGAVTGTVRYPIREFALMAPILGDAVVWISRGQVWQSSTPVDPPNWLVDVPGAIQGWPLQYDDLLIVSAGLFPQISAIHMDTGKIVWHDDRQFSSLPAVYLGSLYALTKEAELVGLDPLTGRQHLSVQFSPASTEEATRSEMYAVVSSDKILLVYFGDSCEIFAFGAGA